MSKNAVATAIATVLIAAAVCGLAPAPLEHPSGPSVSTQALAGCFQPWATLLNPFDAGGYPCEQTIQQLTSLSVLHLVLSSEIVRFGTYCRCIYAYTHMALFPGVAGTYRSSSTAIGGLPIAVVLATTSRREITLLCSGVVCTYGWTLQRPQTQVSDGPGDMLFPPGSCWRR